MHSAIVPCHRSRFCAFAGKAAAAVAIGLLLAGCSGGFGYRSVAEMSEKLPIGNAIDCVRIEVQNGTIGVDVSESASERVVAYAGGVRRAADTAEALTELEKLDPRLQVAVDPARPRTLVLRGPVVAAGLSGLVALELGVRIPAELAVEVVVQGNGHITIGNRIGRTLTQTGRGDLRYERCHGAVEGVTGRGTVIAFDHEGDLDLQTAVGDVQAFVKRPGALLRLVTGKGTVQCGVPPECEFQIDARAEIGRIGADFGLVADRVGDYGAVLVGRRGAAGTKVVMRTESGHLAFKAKEFR